VTSGLFICEWGLFVNFPAPGKGLDDFKILGAVVPFVCLVMQYPVPAPVLAKMQWENRPRVSLVLFLNQCFLTKIRGQS
jgi:hypothetical protein